MAKGRKIFLPNDFRFCYNKFEHNESGVKY